jgi:mannose-1-phosphate guanylyltransferase
MRRIAVIMAGGSGERFWPLSRRLRPKQLLRLTHPEQTLLEESARRIEPLVGNDSIIVATNPILQAPIQEAGVVPSENVWAEPDKRNTLGCLVWTAAMLRARYGADDVAVAIITADHKIDSPDAFRGCASTALDIAEAEGALVTIGIRPDRAETGYGYIEFESGSPVGGGYRVASFREKPSADIAETYVASGRYLWNSGMFFWTLDTFERELKAAQPEVWTTYQNLCAEVLKGDFEAAADVFRQLPNISIDYALMERASNVAVVPSNFPWDDVGAWDALHRTLETDANGNVQQGDTLMLDCTNSILLNEGNGIKLTAVGLSGIVAIVSKDAIMLCPVDQVQRVKEIVGSLPEELK